MRNSAITLNDALSLAFSIILVGGILPRVVLLNVVAPFRNDSSRRLIFEFLFDDLKLKTSKRNKIPS
jgi:hypothetical protein